MGRSKKMLTVQVQHVKKVIYMSIDFMIIQGLDIQNMLKLKKN